MKNIVITGANRGIGLELTRQFAEENSVYALCRSDFPENELNEHIQVIKLDVTDEDAVKEFAEKLNSEKTAVDLLINNAGIAGGDLEELPQYDAATVTEVFKTNAVAPMVLSMHLTEALKRSEHPVMIAVSSKMGTHAQLNDYNAEWWPYSASKAALCYEVSAFAVNEPSIKSISVHPGWVQTDMGGEGADITPAESAAGIKNVYETIDSRESGSMYNYDGKSMDW